MAIQNGVPKTLAAWVTPQDRALSTDFGRYCRTCAGQGQTCCQGHDIYVTPGDCQRIRHYLGVRNFFEYRPCSLQAYADQDDDPVWRQYVFRHDGCRRVLMTRVGGDCLFLENSGCLLPLTVRPLVCRLFPHMYSAKGVTGGWDQDCPIGRTHAEKLIDQGIAGITWQEAVKWHRMLYAEILWEAKAHENRSYL